MILDFMEFVRGRHARRAPPLATFDERACRNALVQLDQAQASEVLTVGARLAATCLNYGHDRRRVANVSMRAFPDAAWVLIFHADGYVREAALRRLTSAASSTGRFVAITARLNDWVPQVRTEAAQAVRRIWPLTSPNIIANAAPYLFRQRYNWRRWADESTDLDEVLSNPDVAASVISLLLEGRSGALGRTLSQALRFPVYDIGVQKLAVEARLPDVRATAMKALFSGKAVWPVGYGWAWTDKSLGLRRRVVLTESRCIAAREPSDLLDTALGDNSALVRKIAADVVVERMRDLPNIAEIEPRLANDRSTAVKDRAAYIRRHLGASM